MSDGSATFTSREFNQDLGRAKRAARSGPVIVTDRGRPAFVLLAWSDYRSLTGGGGLADLLGRTPGVGEIDFDPARRRDVAVPPALD